MNRFPSTSADRSRSVSAAAPPPAVPRPESAPHRGTIVWRPAPGNQLSLVKFRPGTAGSGYQADLFGSGNNGNLPQTEHDSDPRLRTGGRSLFGMLSPRTRTMRSRPPSAVGSWRSGSCPPTARRWPPAAPARRDGDLAVPGVQLKLAPTLTHGQARADLRGTTLFFAPTVSRARCGRRWWCRSASPTTSPPGPTLKSAHPRRIRMLVEHLELVRRIGKRAGERDWQSRSRSLPVKLDSCGLSGRDPRGRPAADSRSMPMSTGERTGQAIFSPAH